MKDLDWATAFLTRFALPLLTGGNVSVGVPLLQKGTERLLRAVDAGLDHSAQGQTLSRLRRQMLAELGTLRDEILLSSDRDAVRLLAALHDVLFLSHPYGKELSASRRAGLIQHIRRQLVVSSQSLPAPSLDSARDGALYEQLLGRYSLLAKLWRLKPAMGPSLTVEAEVLDLVLDSEAQPLAHYLARSCPLLLLLRPPPGPLLLLELVPWLQLSRVTRLFVNTQLRYGMAQALGRIGSSLLTISQQLSEDPDALATKLRKTLWTVLSLFHLRAALTDTQLSMPADETLRNALGLYALIGRRLPKLAIPNDVLSDARLKQRVLHHQQACGERAGLSRLSQLEERCAPLWQGL